jgi:hypothetical protein
MRPSNTGWRAVEFAFLREKSQTPVSGSWRSFSPGYCRDLFRFSFANQVKAALNGKGGVEKIIDFIHSFKGLWKPRWMCWLRRSLQNRLSLSSKSVQPSQGAKIPAVRENSNRAVHNNGGTLRVDMVLFTECTSSVTIILAHNRRSIMKM